MVTFLFLMVTDLLNFFSKNSKQVSIILNQIVDLQFTLSHKGSVVTWLDFILYILVMFSILVYILDYSLELHLFKFLWKKIIIFALNTKYRVRFICPLLKKSNIPFLYYAIFFLLSKRLTSRSSIRKDIPYKILAIGNCSAEIFGCSIES